MLAIVIPAHAGIQPRSLNNGWISAQTLDARLCGHDVPLLICRTTGTTALEFDTLLAIVIPAHAGIQLRRLNNGWIFAQKLDARLRGHDVPLFICRTTRAAQREFSRAMSDVVLNKKVSIERCLRPTGKNNA